MRILIVMGGFFPGTKYGGPPVSIDNFCSLTSNSIECYILTCNHDLGDSVPYEGIKNGWNDRGNCKVMYLTDKDYSFSTFERTAIDLKPDYIYLQGLFQNCVLPCLIIAKKHHIKCVLAPRGELCKGAFKKKYKKIPYIFTLRFLRLLDKVYFQSTSEEESLAIEKFLKISPERIKFLTNIPSIPSGNLIKQVKKEGEGKFIFLSRIVEKKNLLSAIQFFVSIKGRAVFDIYGPIENEMYWDTCQAAIAKLPINVQVSYKGILPHAHIHSIFSQYDSFLFPTFSENYGHVIAEALYSGCIPIISDQTPWSDINEAGAGYAIPLNNKGLFVKSIQDIINANNTEIEKFRENIVCYLKKKQDLDVIRKSYLELFSL